MKHEHEVPFILDQLRQLAVLRWGEADVERQLDGLRETAEQLAVIRQETIESDVEPRFH